LDVINRGLSGYNTEWAIPVFEKVGLFVDMDHARLPINPQTGLRKRGGGLEANGKAMQAQILTRIITVLRKTTRTATRSQSPHSHHLVWRK